MGNFSTHLGVACGGDDEGVCECDREGTFLN